MRIAREALPFVLPPLLVSLGCAIFGNWPWAIVLSLIVLFLLYSFRDPRRRFEGPPELILSPADGTVTKIDTVSDPALAELTGTSGEAVRIVTLLSAFNVRLQRCPCEGVVVGGKRKRGNPDAASRPDAEEMSEGYLTLIQRDEGDFIGVRQIVGLIARGIVPYLTRGQQVERGDYLGLIRFGSRVDLFLPPSYEVFVTAGDKLQGGATPVAMPTDPSSNPLT